MKKYLFLLNFIIYTAFADPDWLKDNECNDDHKLFEAFKKDFRSGNRVNTAESEDRVFQKFKKNKQRVEQNRKLYKMGAVTHKEDINKFADWDDDEFLLTHCGTNVKFAPPGANVTTIHVPESRQFAPPYWDIRLYGPGCLTSVKDQGDCGSCWAFATSASIENLYCQRRPDNKSSLSNQQQLDCNTATYGCDGGWFTTAFDYTKDRGLTLEESYPYLQYKRSCRDSSMKRNFRHTSYVHLPNDPVQIKAFIRTKGACAVGADASKWKLYSTGIFNGAGNSPSCNHAVTLVGYGPDYWLIKNSWGEDWGDAGYIKVSNQKTGGLFTEYVFCPTL